MDFIDGSLKPLDAKTIIRGFRDSETPINEIGTLRYLVDDDSGVTREIIIPNSYYVPKAGVQLLSPQHWAQENDEVFNEGTICITFGNKIKLLWDNQRYCCTVSINKAGCNTGILWTKPSFNRYIAFSSLFKEQATELHALLSQDHTSLERE